MEQPGLVSTAGSLPLTRGLSMLWRSRGPVAVEGKDLVSRVLHSRGLGSAELAAAFLNPTLKQLHSPSQIPDLDRAAARILEAVRAGDRIVIYGDYDVDGITSTAILYHTIKAIREDATVASYVPHRIDEGYGLNADAVREIIAEGARLIVSVDCGVTAKEPARIARELGVDLIITDHHNPPATVDELPEAFAVVHPRHPLSTYPFGELCGAGVAYKLAWRLCTLACGSERIDPAMRERLLELLAPCALGVIADVVPLVDENRVIARHGLAKVKTSKIAGLRALVKASGLDGEKVSAEDVGFKLAPRLNACGRMGHAREAVELLTTARGERAAEIAVDLTRKNEERREVERKIFEEAAAMAQERGMTGPDRRAIVLASASWHAGVVGIVCSRLVERFHRPTILLGERDGHLHGSARSVEGFSLHGGLERCASHLASFGGHDMAAGMKLEASALSAFTEAFTQVCNDAIPPDMLAGRASFDCDARISELSQAAVRTLDTLGPFGRDNPRICLRLRGVRINGRPNTMGRDNSHLFFFVSDAASPMISMRIIAWRGAELIPRLPIGRPFDLLVRPSISDFSKAVECELVDFATE
jgi:single-stranded-DNA-specific exonuclease